MSEERTRAVLKTIFSPLWFAVILFVVAVLLWVLLPNVTVTREEVEVTILNPGLLISVGLLFYYLASFRVSSPVKSDEIGVKVFFEKPFDEVASGPPFAPRFLVAVKVLKRNFEQREFPTEPEKIWRPAKGEAAAAPPEGFKPPVRITFGEVVSDETAKKLLGSIEGKEKKDGSKYSKQDDFEDENTFYHWADREPGAKIDQRRLYTFVSATTSDESEEDGLARRVTAEVSFVLRWRVVKGKGIDFIVNIGSVDNLVQQAEDEMVGILQRLLPTMSVGQALQNISWINAILRYKVKARTHDWGVQISDAYLKQIQFHRDLNSAIADRGEAFYEASAEKERTMRKGEGDAAAAAALEREVLEARAQGYKRIALTIDVSGAEVQAAEVARTVGEGEGTVVIGTDGFRDLVGIGKVLAQSNQKKEKGGE